MINFVHVVLDGQTERNIINMTIEMNGETFLTTQEACNQLGVSRETLNNYVKKGRISRFKKGIGRTAYYKKIDIDRLSELREDIPKEEE